MYDIKVLRPIPFLLLPIMVLFTSCNDYNVVGISESLEFIRSVEPISGAQDVGIDLKKNHRQSLFTVELSGIQSASAVGNGIKRAWCIEYDVPPAVTGKQAGVKLHSTEGKELWRPLNYFLNNREEYKQQYPELTWKEIQVIIWALVEHKPFTIDRISEYEHIGSQFYRDGQYFFDVELAKEVIQSIRANIGSQMHSFLGIFAIIVENEGQTLIIESGETVWAYGQYSFRGQELRNLHGLNGAGLGQWGWIYEMDSEYASTELIAGGGNDDGSKGADEVGTIVGKLEMERHGNLLQVVYNMDSQYYISDLHLWVGCSLEEFPFVGNTANVALGQLPYQYDGDPTSYHVFSINLENYNCSGKIFISAHGGKLYSTGEDESPSIPRVEVQDLGILSTTSNAFIDDAYAIAINDHGEIVGNQWINVCLNKSCDSVFFENQGFRWTQEGGLERLPMYVELFSQRPASDINNKREVVGFQPGPGAVFLDYPHPQGSGPTALGHLLGGDMNNSDALAINDLGQVVGYAENAQGYQRAFIWDLENGMHEIGTLPGHIQSRAVDINNLGQVVGWSQGATSADRHYFLWDSKNGMLDLGTDPVQSINDLGKVSSSLAINNHGQMVNADSYFYDPDKGAIELPLLVESKDCGAYDINNYGQIVGWCSNESGDARAVLWTVSYRTNELVHN